MCSQRGVVQRCSAFFERVAVLERRHRALDRGLPDQYCDLCSIAHNNNAEVAILSCSRCQILYSPNVVQSMQHVSGVGEAWTAQLQQMRAAAAHPELQYMKHVPDPAGADSANLTSSSCSLLLLLPEDLSLDLTKAGGLSLCSQQ